jgi:hypothetical protein
MNTPTDPRTPTPHRLERDSRARIIADLNDRCRTAMGVCGRLIQTQGISALPDADQSAIREKVETYDTFDAGDDPYHERDFGAFDHAGQMVFWKIDYYDRAYEYGSPDPADPRVTRRVLTIMLASEY